jgi:DNA-binding transcriptional regulator YdaS (Cro superfamily)
MKFKTYYDNLTAAGKRDLAKKAKTSAAYLSQLANGHRKAGLKTLFVIEAATKNRVTKKDLRPDLYRKGRK